MRLIIICFALISSSLTYAQNIQNGDQQFKRYEAALTGKKVAVFANNASQVDNQNIVNFLLQNKINVVKIFTPEHGFSVEKDAGAAVGEQQNEFNHKLQVVSLYGSKDKPDSNDLKNVDIVVFDIQDVGVRFYTYISSLQKLMEALADNNKPLLILDRANPNSFYIDGPVLERKYKSFVGMQAIPIVYGMTIGEYAQMLIGEQWLDLKPKNKAKKLRLQIIPVAGYTHASKYVIDSKPSPNLPNMTAIYLYPSLGLFEGTQLSIGRGTDMPFQVIGHPDYKTDFSFTPEPTTGATNPPLKGKICYGWNLQKSPDETLTLLNGQINLNYLITAYHAYPDKEHFFTPFFDKLAGINLLKKQIITGKSESEIRESWQPELAKFKRIRHKYLIYPESQ